MSEKNRSHDKTLLALGVAVALPMVLASGPLAGYVIARYILVKYFGFSEIVIPVLTGLGFLGSGIQAFRLIKRIKELD